MRRHPEVLLISAVIRTGDFTAATRNGASVRLFHVYAEEWRWIEKQFSRSRRAPGKVSFKAQFPDFGIIRTDDVATATEMVKKSHARYEIQTMMTNVVEMMESDRPDEATALISRNSTQLLYEIEHTADAIDVVSGWEETYEDVLSRIERAQQLGSSGIPTGMATLDTITGGLQPGWLVSVAARLGVGKTWALIAMAHGAVQAGYRVLYFSLEQSRHQIAMRMQGLAAAQLGFELNPASLTHGMGISKNRYKEILQEIQKNTPGQFLVNDATRGRVSSKTVEAAIEAKEPDLVIIDYMTLMQTYGPDKWQGVAQLSGDLKVAATEFDVPIVTANQLNRSGTGKDPGAEHIAQSDAVGQDSDLVITLTNQTDHIKTMNLIKNRHGQSGDKWYIEFNPAKGRFHEISGNKAQDIMDSDMDED